MCGVERKSLATVDVDAASVRFPEEAGQFEQAILCEVLVDGSYVVRIEVDSQVLGIPVRVLAQHLGEVLLRFNAGSCGCFAEVGVGLFAAVDYLVVLVEHFVDFFSDSLYDVTHLFSPFVTCNKLSMLTPCPA